MEIQLFVVLSDGKGNAVFLLPVTFIKRLTMKEIKSLSVTDGVLGMTSLEIAEVTGKQHSNVMRDIRSILRQGVHQFNFELMFRISKLGNDAERKDPYYRLTPKGCLILASGYDALLREKIIDRLEDLEKNSKPQLPGNYLDALKQLVASEEQKQQLTLENRRQAEQLEVKDTQIAELNTTVSEMQDKVSYLDLIMQSKEHLTATQIGLDYGMSAVAFNRMLAAFKVQRKVNNVWVVYAPYITEGYVTSNTIERKHADGKPYFIQHTVWTQKGRAFLYQQLKKKGVLPTIERHS